MLSKVAKQWQCFIPKHMLLISMVHGINTNMTTFFSYLQPQTTHKTFWQHFLSYKAYLHSLKNMKFQLQFHNLMNTRSQTMVS